MKLVYLLLSQISPELLRFDSSDFISLMWADLNRWYFSFGASGVDERNDALLFLWKLCKGGAGISMLPCVPTQRICFGSRNNCNHLTFKCLDEDFYFLSYTNSSEQEIDTSQWFSLIQQCLSLGTFEYHQVTQDVSDLFSRWVNSNPRDSWLSQIQTKNIFSLDFINQLLRSVENESSRFSLALEFVLQKHRTGAPDAQFWSIDSTLGTNTHLIEVPRDFIISPLPPQWLPTPELHAKYSQLTRLFPTFSIDFRLADALLSESRCSELRKSSLDGLFQFLIQKTSGWTQDESQVLKFPSRHLRSESSSINDWKLLDHVQVMKGDLLPYLLAIFPMDELKKTFYRNSEETRSQSAAGLCPSSWVKEISCYLPQWSLIPSLVDLCRQLEVV
jgi:hypothetical protein